MIQRIQTLFLLGVVIISIGLFFIPLSEKTYLNTEVAKEVQMILKVNNLTKTEGGVIETIQSNMALLLVNLLILTATFIIIFLYKNRNLQMKLCMLSSLLSTGLLLLIFYYSEAMGPAETKVHYQAGVYLVAVQVLLLFLARNSIRKDEMLVRSADRIR